MKYNSILPIRTAAEVPPATSARSAPAAPFRTENKEPAEAGRPPRVLQTGRILISSQPGYEWNQSKQRSSRQK